MKVKPQVPIVLDKPRVLLMDMNAMVEFEKATGKNMLQQTATSITAKDLRALLWACLKHEDKDLTIEQVGSMIHAGNLQEVSEKLGEAWEVASPDVEEGAAPLAQDPPTG